MLDQFVSCVSGRFGDGLADGDDVSGGGGGPRRRVREAAGSDESESEQTVELGAVPEEIDGRSLEDSRPGRTRRAATARPASADANARPPAAPKPLPPTADPTPPKLDLGPTKVSPPSDTSQPDIEVIATIGSVVLKRFGPALAVIAVLIFIISKIIKRNR